MPAPADDELFDIDALPFRAVDRATELLAQMRHPKEVILLVKKAFPRLSDKMVRQHVLTAKKKLADFTAERRKEIQNAIIGSYLEELKVPDYEIRNNAREALREMLALDEGSKKAVQTPVGMLIGSISDEEATRFLAAWGFVKQEQRQLIPVEGVIEETKT